MSRKAVCKAWLIFIGRFHKISMFLYNISTGIFQWKEFHQKISSCAPDFSPFLMPVWGIDYDNQIILGGHIYTWLYVAVAMYYITIAMCSLIIECCYSNITAKNNCAWPARHNTGCYWAWYSGLPKGSPEWWCRNNSTIWPRVDTPSILHYWAILSTTNL